jgi:Sulfatase
MTLGAALLLLNASLTFQSIWPTPAILWRGTLSIELAVFILVLVSLRRRLDPPSPLTLRWVSATFVALALGRYAEVTSEALYGRDINLYWDLRFVPAVAALLARPERLWLVVLAALVVLLTLGLLYAGLRWAVGRVGEAMTSWRERRALGVVAAVLAMLFVSQRLSGLVFPDPVTLIYARQARLMVMALVGPRSLAPSPSMASDLSLVRGADVFVVFVESYGAVSYDRAEFARALAVPRRQFEAVIHDTRRDVVSAYVESPTFGGSSWLAHISLLSGVEVRDHDTNALLMTQKRDTLVGAFKRHGYRTIALMPGTWQGWPEGSFYGFDDIYDGPRLNYRGPQFGWWDIPDQFAIAQLDALEVNRAPRAPLFVVFPTISSHIPFTPTPPYQPVWARMLTDRPFDTADVERALDRQPDWLHLGPRYVDALSYAYQSIGGYLRVRGDRDFIVVVLGDHQPAAAVSGVGASWDVPVHVVASRRPVLDRFLTYGFREGLTPARPPAGKMHSLTRVLLDAFGGYEAAVKVAP